VSTIITTITGTTTLITTTTVTDMALLRKCLEELRRRCGEDAESDAPAPGEPGWGSQLALPMDLALVLHPGGAPQLLGADELVSVYRQAC
jgi:hypothetical protein